MTRTTAHAQTVAKTKTCLGTLNFFDGFPDDATTQKVYDDLDFDVVCRHF